MIFFKNQGNYSKNKKSIKIYKKTLPEGRVFYKFLLNHN